MLLLFATLVTTTLVGAERWLGYQAGLHPGGLQVSLTAYLAGGLWYSLSIIAILGAHEMGHYLACRYYKVNATPPYFLPLPPPFFSGTLGAFIKIRSPFGNKRQLFDIGIAGPLAGFIVAIPVLFIGMALSTRAPIPTVPVDDVLADPLLFQFANWVRFGQAHLFVNWHPMVFAAWIGCLATSLNLFPVGQFDGGHISYAVIGRHSTKITYLTMAVALALALEFRSAQLLVWTGLMAVMLRLFGVRHPSTLDDDEPVGGGRIVLAVVAAVIFVLCFMPKPVGSFILGK